MATLALESPYYGSRRPPYQEGSKLVRVSDLLTLGRTTIEESLYLLAWAQREKFQRLGEQKTRQYVGICIMHLLPPGSYEQAMQLWHESGKVSRDLHVSRY